MKTDRHSQRNWKTAGKKHYLYYY